MKDTVSKSWFCVFNNPREHGYDGTYDEILESMAANWIKDNPTRVCALTYCLSADGLEHIHAVLEDDTAMRFSKVKKCFPTIHIEPTKGNKGQAEDYINKVGVFAEKGEKILAKYTYGEIKGHQGSRVDIDNIRKYVNEGMTPQQIFDMNIRYRKYEKMVKDEFFAKRIKDTPFLRDVSVEWHVGDTGTGKTYFAKQLVDEIGEDDIYFISDYDNGAFDNYSGQHVLFLDEFRGQFRFSVLLGILQGYKQQFHSRYTNIYGLWERVIISSILPPERVYEKMVSDNKDIDTCGQLMRRINKVVYHYKKDNNYLSVDVPMSEYMNYEVLKTKYCVSKFLKISEYEQSEIPAEFLS